MRDVLPDLLRDVQMEIQNEIIFQLDGTPAHFSRQLVMGIIDYDNRLIDYEK